MPAFGTATGQYLPAIRSLHPLTKTMNRFPAAIMWLKCAFHTICFRNNLKIDFQKYQLPLLLFGERTAKVRLFFILLKKIPTCLYICMHTFNRLPEKYSSMIIKISSGIGCKK